MKQRQVEFAKRFQELHRGPRLLIMPNVWDPIGARLMESLGFPAVATASMAVAASLGYNDGELVTFECMLDVIVRIAASVDVPVSADIERGYSDTADGVGEHVARVIEAGAVGVNLEDGLVEGVSLRGIDDQVERLRAARDAAERAGVPIVINARVDLFMDGPPASHEERMEEAIERSRAYLAAGADCVYPITLGDIPSLTRLRDAIGGAPINVYAYSETAPLRDLEAAGMRRVTVGPGLLKSSLAAMKRAAEALKNYEPYDVFTAGVPSSDDLRALVRKDRME